MPGANESIYVAFDKNGKPYAFALHPQRLPPLAQRDQNFEVDMMRKQCVAEGGQLQLLTPTEFERKVLIAFPFEGNATNKKGPRP